MKYFSFLFLYSGFESGVYFFNWNRIDKYHCIGLSCTWCASYSTFQLALVTFQVLNSHMQLVVPIQRCPKPLTEMTHLTSSLSILLSWLPRPIVSWFSSYLPISPMSWLFLVFFTRPLSTLSPKPLPRLDYPFRGLSIEMLMTPTVMF